MSIPIQKVKSLSEDFNVASPNTQRNVLMYTGGAKPTSKYKTQTKIRCDSVELSPTTESVLLFYGLKKKKK